MRPARDNETGRRLLLSFQALLLALLRGAASTFAWLHDGLANSGNYIKAGQFAVRLDIVKDVEGVLTDDNILWSSGEGGVVSLQEEIDLAAFGYEDAAFICVSNLSTSTVPAGYSLHLTAGGAGCRRATRRHENSR